MDAINRYNFKPKKHTDWVTLTLKIHANTSTYQYQGFCFLLGCDFVTIYARIPDLYTFTIDSRWLQMTPYSINLAGHSDLI